MSSRVTSSSRPVWAWTTSDLPPVPDGGADRADFYDLSGEMAGLMFPCEQAETACGEPEVYRWWLYRAPFGDPPLTIGQPGWERTGTLCAAPGVAGIDPVVPGPPGEYVLVTMPMSVFTTSVEPVLFDTVLAGVPIQVRATPVRWAWDFGAGERGIGPTREPGSGYPALRHTHAYASRGSYEITMTTFYRGEYSLDGDTWLPVVGQAQVQGPAHPVQALAGHNVLVAEPEP